MALSTALRTTALLERYQSVRGFTSQLCEPLSAEDCAIQSMPDASPARWHLAHTTWFFETFVLAQDRQYRPFDAQFAYLFNSYYNSLGPQFPRPQRGTLSRPDLGTIQAYRRYVDEQLVARLAADVLPEHLLPVVLLGTHHEQQHQELILTDVKHMLAGNPLAPVYREGTWDTASSEGAPRASQTGFRRFPEGLAWIGHDGNGFAFDNEGPRHRVFLEAYELAERPVTCGEYQAFIEDGGYERPELWLSLGWQTVKEAGWNAPLYWLKRASQWQQFTLAGLCPIDAQAPVCHISYFEADAFARWAEARLPTEAEWEHAAESLDVTGNFAPSLLARGAALHPQPAAESAGLAQMFGDVWEWTSSAYAAYPRFRAVRGALGEYNAKFMCNQYVLRGGSCASPMDHVRPTYRNFFPPGARWQFSGLRLARDP